jgi:hypothetical protein
MSIQLTKSWGEPPHGTYASHGLCLSLLWMDMSVYDKSAHEVLLTFPLLVFLLISLFIGLSKLVNSCVRHARTELLTRYLLVPCLLHFLAGIFL